MPTNPYTKTNTYHILPSQFLKPFIFQLPGGEKKHQSVAEKGHLLN